MALAGSIDDESAPRDPLLVAADLKFDLLHTPENVDLEAAKTKLLEIIKEKNMVHFYECCVEENALELDEMLMGSMSKEVEGALAACEEAIETAKLEQGDSEVRAEKVKRAEIITFSKDKEAAVAAWEEIDSLSAGKRIDTVLTIMRIALAYEDTELFARAATTCEEIVEKAGDWDRRNRFIVYRGIQALRERNFKVAGQLLLKVAPSFTATEVIDFDKLVFYIVLVNIIHVDRVHLKKKIIDNPDILQVIDTIPNLTSLVNKLYECNYNEYFKALVKIMSLIRGDRYLNTHEKFLLHEYRFVGYDQFLRPYRSVTLQTMSDEFGLPTEFLENDICGFITEGRIKCSIDSVDGVIANRQYNQRDVEYQKVIKRGDNLINRLEKLSKNLLL